MASSSLVLGALLLFLSAAGLVSYVHSYVGNTYASGLVKRPVSKLEYQIYIVILSPRPDSGTMDDATRQSWYQSFLPSNLTDSGEPRLVCSYKAIFDGFAARLTKAELEVMSKKPGFLRWFPERTRELF